MSNVAQGEKRHQMDCRAHRPPHSLLARQVYRGRLSLAPPKPFSGQAETGHFWPGLLNLPRFRETRQLREAAPERLWPAEPCAQVRGLYSGWAVHPGGAGPDGCDVGSDLLT